MDSVRVPGPDGETLAYLNGPLAERQRVSPAQLSALILSHQLRHVLFEGARSVIEAEADVEAKRLKLKLLAKLFDELESEQQRLWNFPVDSNFHRFFDFPGCSCPKLDNAERVGTPYTIKASDCLIHGA